MPIMDYIQAQVAVRGVRRELEPGYMKFRCFGDIRKKHLEKKNLEKSRYNIRLDRSIFAG
jgi:hypothetical protein